jgi:hypothetical protein
MDAAKSLNWLQPRCPPRGVISEEDSCSRSERHREHHSLWTQEYRPTRELSDGERRTGTHGYSDQTAE